MAEIFLLTRGHSDHVEKWVRCMRSQFFPMKFKKKIKDPDTGEEVEVEKTRVVEGQLRPYQLWGYVCPEEFVQPLCNNLGIPTKESWFHKKNWLNKVDPKTGGPAVNDEHTSFQSGFGVQGYLWALRKALRAKKLPDIDPSKGFWHNPIYREHVNVLGIGWMPDAQIKTPLGEHEGV